MPKPPLALVPCRGSSSRHRRGWLQNQGLPTPTAELKQVGLGTEGTLGNKSCLRGTSGSRAARELEVPWVPRVLCTHGTRPPQKVAASLGGLRVPNSLSK